ncbi:MAG: site-specific integrase [Lachnospiraceae bacterium]|nr:site-specific integrase [Lachnospiraceae bacterium]MBR3243834.1 site-specific integrase [Parasporobacterium sp.]MBR3359802.1 site-specific integrase [Lachnospiraceae bacterium]
MSNAEIILNELLNSGIISEGDIRNLEDMKRKNAVLLVHDQRIWQGKNDRRWFTYIHVEDGRKRVAKKTEKELIDYLYDFYEIEENTYRVGTLKELYEEWIQYKLRTSSRASSVRRMDTDYKRFYLNEPLAEKILNTPLLMLTVADIKEWAYGIIKKYDLTRKGFNNARAIISQVYKYLMEKDITDRNTALQATFPSAIFRKERKKPASTQIFYPEELSAITQVCLAKAKNRCDPAYIAIPLIFLTGMRIGECLALTESDCNRDIHTISVSKMLSVQDVRNDDGTWSKRQFQILDSLKCGSDPRDIMVTDQAFQLIDMAVEINKKRLVLSPYLFEGITESNVQLKLRRICKDLGIECRSPHKGRKTYISNLLNKGLDPDFVREQVGHKDLQTTYNSYTFSTTRKEKQLEQLEKALID